MWKRRASLLRFLCILGQARVLQQVIVETETNYYTDNENKNIQYLMCTRMVKR